MKTKLKRAIKFAKKNKKAIIKIAILLVAPGGLFILGAMLVKKLVSKI